MRPTIRPLRRGARRESKVFGGILGEIRDPTIVWDQNRSIRGPLEEKYPQDTICVWFCRGQHLGEGLERLMYVSVFSTFVEVHDGEHAMGDSLQS